MSDSKLPFGDLLNNKIPLDDFGAKGFSLNERCDFSGHKSGKIDPHFNSEIINDSLNNPVKRDLTNTQLPGLNQYQVGGKKNLDLMKNDLYNPPLNDPLQVNKQPTIGRDPFPPNNLSGNQDIWPKNDVRKNIDLNGYAQGETTSQGFSPNPLPGQQQPGGMPPLNTNSIGNPINNMNNPGPMNNRTSVPGTSLGGYFVPNTDFMK